MINFLHNAGGSYFIGYIAVSEGTRVFLIRAGVKILFVIRFVCFLAKFCTRALIKWTVLAGCRLMEYIPADQGRRCRGNYKKHIPAFESRPNMIFISVYSLFYNIVRCDIVF